MTKIVLLIPYMAFLYVFLAIGHGVAFGSVFGSIGFVAAYSIFSISSWYAVSAIEPALGLTIGGLAKAGFSLIVPGIGVGSTVFRYLLDPFYELDLDDDSVSSESVQSGDIESDNVESPFGQQPQQQSNQQPQQQSQQPKETAQQDSQNEYVQEPPEIDFDDVAGNRDLIAELRDKVIDPLQNPEKYEEYGLGVETGFLLYGPPGTGKTYTTKALAGELGLNWMPVKGSDLNSTIVGGGTENIAEMFAEARENQPVLLFLDEIDQLVPERGGHNQHEDTTRQVNTMLEEVSAIHDSDDEIVVIGATNRPDRIDDAMLRSGRLNTKIEVPYPYEEARILILDKQLDAPRRPDLDFHEIAPHTDELSAADMEAVADEAARTAMKRDEPVDTNDVITAINSVRSQ